VHMKQLFDGNTEWLQVASDLRADRINDVEGYEKFFTLSKNNKLKGCGPAYYTKLLVFLPSDDTRGLIMDQWMARSINLLTGQEIVKMERSAIPGYRQKTRQPITRRFATWSKNSPSMSAARQARPLSTRSKCDSFPGVDV